MVLTFSYFAFNIQASQVGFLYLLGWLISTTLQIHSLIWGGIVPAFRSRKLRKKRHDHCACPGFTWFHQLLWKWCYSFHLMDRGHKKKYCLWEIQRQLCMSQWLLLKVGEKNNFFSPNKSMWLKHSEVVWGKTLPSRRLTARPLKSCLAPVGKDRLPVPPFFRAELLNSCGVYGCFQK